MPNLLLIYSAGVRTDDLQTISNTLQFNIGALPVKYLGLPLVTTRLSYNDCIPLLERARKRINSWKNRVLSYAGRTTLIKSVLNSLHIYWSTCYVLPKETINDLNAIMRNFLWSASDTYTKSPMVSWSKVCKPYNEGGLGIRCIETANKSAMTRHIWNVVSNKNNLWVHWVQRNLIKHRDFWLMEIPRECSWSWRRILDSREIAKKLIIHSIGNGDNTLLWKDPWHPMGILMDRFPQHLQYDSTLHKNAKVSSLIRGDKWDAMPHIQIAISDIFDGLAAVELDVEAQDEVVWLEGRSDEYSSKSAYNSTRERSTPVPWARLIWFKVRVPRQSFVGWLLMHKALKTKEKLKTWKKLDDSTCSLCNADSETENHLFYECWYSKLVWKYILFYMGYNRQPLTWEQEVAWCIQHFTGTSTSMLIKKLCFNATIYHLWQERNRRVFQSKRKVALDLIANIVEDVRLRIVVLNLEVEDIDANRKLCEKWRMAVTFAHRPITQHRWSRPEPEWFMINSDGSMMGARGGYGAIIRDHQGVVIAAAAGSKEAKSVILHELQGVELGIKLASQYRLRKIILCMDSANALRYLTTTNAPPWEARHITRRIKRAMAGFEEHRMMHAPRETNYAADHLAKLMPTAEFLEITPSSFAEDHKKIIFNDAIGRIYTRM